MEAERIFLDLVIGFRGDLNARATVRPLIPLTGDVFPRIYVSASSAT